MFLIRRAFLYQVMDIPHEKFEEKLEHMKEAKGVKADTDLTAADLKELVGQYKECYIEAKGEPFPSGMYARNSFSKLKLCFSSSTLISMFAL